MIQSTVMIVGDWRKRSLSSARANQHETLIDEMLRERAAVLARAGFAVEDALAELSEAVTLAQPGDVRRIFLDAEPELGRLLGKLELEAGRQDFVAPVSYTHLTLPTIYSV